MPGGFPHALTEARRNAHRATQGGEGIEDTTRHANATQRAAEGA